MKLTSFLLGHSRPAEKDMLDPDVRFLLANERTMLSWVRTALTVMAGGVALTQLGEPNSTRIIFGVAAVLFGALMALIGYVRFLSTDKAIRAHQLPSVGSSMMLIVVGVLGFAVVISLLQLSLL